MLIKKFLGTKTSTGWKFTRKNDRSVPLMENDRSVTLIDSPGFSRLGMSDVEVFHSVAQYLLTPICGSSQWYTCIQSSTTGSLRRMEDSSKSSSTYAESATIQMLWWSLQCGMMPQCRCDPNVKREKRKCASLSASGET